MTAAIQATVGIGYGSAERITCNAAACAPAVVVSGTFRTSKTHAAAAAVVVSAASIRGSNGETIPASAFRFSCTGGVVGAPFYPGSPLLQATNAPLSDGPATCESWSGPLVANYQLVVTLVADATRLPADGFAAVVLTATATAN